METVFHKRRTDRQQEYRTDVHTSTLENDDDDDACMLFFYSHTLKKNHLHTDCFAQIK